MVHVNAQVLSRRADEWAMKEFEQGPGSDHNHYVRKVTLPTGEVIEVTSIEQVPGSADDLHICPVCTSQFVYPVDWAEAGRTSWEVSLRCPNCEWTTTSVHDDEAIQRFDETLDDGTEALVADLRQLTRANMEADVERFVAAIYAEHLLPEDF
jgi:hypothetical protein